MDWAWIIPIPVFIAYTIRMLTYLHGWEKAARFVVGKGTAMGWKSIDCHTRKE